MRREVTIAIDTPDDMSEESVITELWAVLLDEFHGPTFPIINMHVETRED